ncbi:MAG: hypothetical protein JWM96_725 [Alphaproteobacteria bacterium]|nr:hypothetical protein [Alphaproteobacteria bacterium]
MQQSAALKKSSGFNPDIGPFLCLGTVAGAVGGWWQMNDFSVGDVPVSKLFGAMAGCFLGATGGAFMDCVTSAAFYCADKALEPLRKNMADITKITTKSALKAQQMALARTVENVPEIFHYPKF